MTNLLPETRIITGLTNKKLDLFGVKDNKGKLVRGGFTDKMQAKAYRNQLNGTADHFSEAGGYTVTYGTDHYKYKE